MASSKKYLIDLAIRAGSDQISVAEMALIFLAGAGLGAVAIQVWGIIQLIF